jgi:hypothetical protein
LIVVPQLNSGNKAMGNLARRFRMIEPIRVEPDPASAAIVKPETKPEPKDAPKKRERASQQV